MDRSTRHALVTVADAEEGATHVAHTQLLAGIGSHPTGFLVADARPTPTTPTTARAHDQPRLSDCLLGLERLHLFHQLEGVVHIACLPSLFSLLPFHANKGEGGGKRAFHTLTSKASSTPHTTVVPPPPHTHLGAHGLHDVWARETEAEKAATRAATKARQEEMKAIMERHLAQKKAAAAQQ